MYACIEGNIGIGKGNLYQRLGEVYHLRYDENEKHKQKIINPEDITSLPRIKFIQLPSFLAYESLHKTHLKDHIMDYISALIHELDDAIKTENIDLILSAHSLISIRFHVLTMTDIGFLSLEDSQFLLQKIDSYPHYLQPEYIIFMDLDFDPNAPGHRNNTHEFTYPSRMYFESYEHHMYKFMFRWMTNTHTIMHQKEPLPLQNDHLGDLMVESLLAQICKRWLFQEQRIPVI